MNSRLQVRIRFKRDITLESHRGVPALLRGSYAGIEIDARFENVLWQNGVYVVDMRDIIAALEEKNLGALMQFLVSHHSRLSAHEKYGVMPVLLVAPECCEIAEPGYRN